MSGQVVIACHDLSLSLPQRGRMYHCFVTDCRCSLRFCSYARYAPLSYAGCSYLAGWLVYCQANCNVYATSQSITAQNDTQRVRCTLHFFKPQSTLLYLARRCTSGLKGFVFDTYFLRVRAHRSGLWTGRRIRQLCGATKVMTATLLHNCPCYPFENISSHAATSVTLS